jgi:hypothetical protein
MYVLETPGADNPTPLALHSRSSGVRFGSDRSAYYEEAAVNTVKAQRGKYMGFGLPGPECKEVPPRDWGRWTHSACWSEGAGQRGETSNRSSKAPGCRARAALSQLRPP